MATAQEVAELVLLCLQAMNKTAKDEGYIVHWKAVKFSLVKDGVFKDFSLVKSGIQMKKGG